MGFFDFIKSAGKKLGIGDDDAAPDVEAVKKELASHNLGTDKVDVAVIDDKVVLKGTVKDQSAFEKAVIAVGNTLGISKVQADELKIAGPDAATLVEAKAPVFYTVKKGDNLWKIAEAQYGKGKGAKHTVIFEANTPMLTHPDKIYPGQVLRIPDLAD
ncbi:MULTISPECIES: peptidoglycan-binding protein LysM [Alphaproteobacteria]|uniref:Peptidoglycan-binding protein LysM n=2 Tax=Alphaproteobacteria TaxID=28211 RepID=A0A512HMA3_9HYPH|nr:MULTISPECIES: peptidoglycan-binding protein LysM [Alphaproteobacteria]GEO86559.1 peptidoglycan-binding protein LysM [Ciceribacter naphthalenivorans]GLR20869.1 peptidoglycan-binding protein LysM [Ciceribacter naphthalenivorans]GLT03725.1 peptidoglycan-binding protein LysM [Sphingomonas psychrolutea]